MADAASGLRIYVGCLVIVGLGGISLFGLIVDHKRVVGRRGADYGLLWLRDRRVIGGFRVWNLVNASDDFVRLNGGGHGPLHLGDQDVVLVLARAVEVDHGCGPRSAEYAHVVAAKLKK